MHNAMEAARQQMEEKGSVQKRDLQELTAIVGVVKGMDVVIKSLEARVQAIEHLIAESARKKAG